MHKIKRFGRPLAAALGIVGGIAVALALPLAGLTQQAAMALGILMWAIIWWIGGVIPEYLTAIAMAILFVVACAVPTETVFSQFAGSTWWLLVAAFGLGLGMQKSGLMKHMARAILRIFPRTFKAQVAGFMAAGTLIGPFIPSLSAKAVMLAPLSMSVSDSMGYQRKGPQAEGLFLAMFTGIRNVGPAIISASVIGYALLATFPESTQAQFDMLHWFLGMLPWFIVVMLLNYVAIVALYKPRAKSRAPHAGTSETAEKANSDISDTLANTADTKAPTQAEPSRTPLTKEERRMAVIMGVCVILWMTESLHGIASHIVALAALVATIALGVLNTSDIKNGIAWDNLIFMGIVFGLAEVFAALGIDTWVVGLCEPIMSELSQNPYLLVLGIAATTILLRFVIISEIPYLNIFMAFMIPIAITAGINPWIIGVCAYATVSPWFARYENPIYLSAYYATEGKMVRQTEMAKYCAIYMGISTAGLLISVPYWQWMGLL